MHCQSSTNGDMTTKLDMRKAFNRVEWPFLRQVMTRMGLSRDWVNLVMHFMKTGTFSFIINGKSKGFLKPTGGICQQWRF